MNQYNSFDEMISSLILKSSFPAMFLSKFKRQENNQNNFFIGFLFDIDSNEIILEYNFKNLNQLSDLEIDKLFEHETLHIYNKHFTRFKNYFDTNNNITEQQKYIYNIAADLAINPLIDKMPVEIKIDNKHIRTIFPNDYNLPNNLLLEDYIELLQNMINENEPSESESNETDNESSDSNEDEENKEKSNDSDNEEKNESSDSNEDEENKEKSNDSDNEEENESSDSNEDEENKEKSNDSDNNEENKSNENTSSDSESNESDSEQINNNPINQKYEQFNESIYLKSHEKWYDQNNNDPNTDYLIDNYIRIKLDDVVKEYTCAFGNIPGRYEELINELTLIPKLPYYLLIKKFVRGSKISKQKVSYSKINKKRMFVFKNSKNILESFKLTCPFPGKRFDKSFKIGIILDTSASIPLNDDGIYEALKGIESIIKNDKYSIVTLIQCDTKIVEEKKIKSISDIKRLTIKGRGGTNLLPALHRFKELKNDIVLVFTDGYFSPLHDYIWSLPKHILWILPEKYSTDTNIKNIGRIIYFPVNK